MVTTILRQVHLLLFDGAHQTLCEAVLPGGPDLSHTNCDLVNAQQISVRRGSILNALIRVMNLGLTRLQSTVQSGQCQVTIQVAPQMPAADRACEDIHDYS